jgi:hypothetical protein
MLLFRIAFPHFINFKIILNLLRGVSGLRPDWKGTSLHLIFFNSVFIATSQLLHPHSPTVLFPYLQGIVPRLVRYIVTYPFRRICYIVTYPFRLVRYIVTYPFRLARYIVTYPFRLVRYIVTYPFRLVRYIVTYPFRLVCYIVTFRQSYQLFENFTLLLLIFLLYYLS